jgi:AcrR family transcriptional regulator
MTSSGNPSSAAATDRGRRRQYDAEASREALLDAAGELFLERGYDRATIRDIGHRAGVDPALIARYFGSKEGLYLASLERGGGRSLPGDAVAALGEMLTSSEHRGLGPVPRAMVAPALSEPVREQIMRLVQDRAVEPIAAGFAERGVDDAQLRAEALVALALGVSLTRATGTLPALAAAPLDELIAAVAPLARSLQEGA